MMNDAIRLPLCALLFPASISAAPLTSLSSDQLSTIFARADQQNNQPIYQFTSDLSIPALQILPRTQSPRKNLPIAAQCIKLYNCNQDVCLVDYHGTKYAISEPIFQHNSQRQKNTAVCKPLNKQLQGITALPVTIKKEPADSANTLQPPQKTFYKVVNVDKNDTLNIRAKQHYKSRKIGTIPNNASCISLSNCNKSWCHITYNDISGWSNQRYLSKMSPQLTTDCQR